MNEQETKYDMIAIGDTTQDVFLEMTDADVQCDDQGENCKLCLDFADKIAVDKKTDVSAVGNAANHAIGMARLGLRASIYSIVGDAVQGHLADKVFQENGVDTAYLAFDKERETNFSAIINFKAERAILVYHEPRDYQLPQFAPTKWIYLTSASGDGVREMHAQVSKYLSANPQVKMAFNPGTHQIHLGGKELRPLLARTNTLFLNREESADVLGVETDDIKELCDGFHEIGVELMVLTDGPEGSYVSDGQQILHLKIFRGPVNERTGAGDSYGSGFTAAIMKGKSIAEAMLWGNANSTSVVKFIGAREGLLKEEQIEASIKENSDITPTKYK